MARPNKIEQFELQHIVARCINDGITASRQIAAECTKEVRNRGIKEDISHSAVVRYLSTMEGSASVMTAPPPGASASSPDKRREQAVKAVPERVQRLVDRDIDLIELQYQTTSTLAQRFEWIANLPNTFDARMQQLHDLLKQEGTDTATLDHWGLAFTLELRRNIGNMAVLNREIRQNSQFMASLREKAFEFNLIQEYLENALNEIRDVVGPEAFEQASERLVMNPRLQRIVDEIHKLGGGDVG